MKPSKYDAELASQFDDDRFYVQWEKLKETGGTELSFEDWFDTLDDRNKNDDGLEEYRENHR